MSWVKLDDQFTDHPKIAQAGALAGWLYVCGLTYSARYLTDGFIPAAQVRRLADVDEAGTLATRLVEAGLWERCEGGYQIHDYLDYQPSGEQVRNERAASNVRVANWRAKKHSRNGNGQSNSVTYPQEAPYPVDIEGVCNAECNAVTNAPVTPAPSPSPSPSVDLDYPQQDLDPPHPATAATAPLLTVDNFTPMFDTFWQTYPGRPNPDHRPHGREPTRKALRAVPARDWDAVLVGVGHYAVSRDVLRGYAIDPVRWVKERRWTEWQTAEPPVKEQPRGETRNDLAARGTARTRSDGERLAHIAAAYLATPESDSGDSDDGSAWTPAAATGGGRVLSYRPGLGPGTRPHS